MPSERPRIVAVVGPTGSGKTDFAVQLALRFHAEIVNADSRQVYRRLDIGSAKPTRAQRAAVPHHLIDVVEPDQPFNCAQFRALAMAAIRDILRRGRRVLVVGGTGLYVKVLRGGLFDGPARSLALRDELARQESGEPGSLFRRLRAVDPITATRLHPHDHVRVIRALEVYEITGQPMSAWQRDHGFATHDFDMLTLGLRLSRTALHARIAARCQAMLDTGLIDEVRALYAAGFDPALPALRSPGYREIGDYVRGAYDLPTAIERMARATRQLAKRQGTWFRADPQVVWCEPELAILLREAEAFWGTPER